MEDADLLDLKNPLPESDSTPALATRLEILEAMVDGAREGLCIMSPGATMLHSNRVAGDLLGFQPKEAAGQPVQALGVERGFDWALAGEVATGRVATSAIQTLGTGQKLLVSAVPSFSADGSLAYIVLTIREITGMGQVMSRLRDAVEEAEQSRSMLARTTDRELALEEVVAHSPSLAAVRETALQYAAVDSTVLLLGETGAGKGLFARLIHQASARSAGPFLEVNCGAIPEGLMEAELFGYARGAFTGADSKGKIGLVELAHKGTLLLNEIGDLPLVLQVKLLRFLEDGEVWAVGAIKPRKPDVRIIASTNRDLQEMIAAGTFRGDLFYRLNVLCLEIPPLREHAEDIPRLVELTLSRLERKIKRRRAITPAALRALARYPFPGNVRELLNLVERLMVTSASDTIDVADLPQALLRLAGEVTGAVPRAELTLRKALQKVESQLLRDALARYRTQALAAKHLGVTQSTVARKARRYGLDSEGSASRIARA
jgi:transcriptional regulator with PAS, ATPase and Fis domain